MTDEQGSPHDTHVPATVAAARPEATPNPWPAESIPHATSRPQPQWTAPYEVHPFQPGPAAWHPNPYAPAPPPQPSVVTGESAGATTVQQVTVNVPTMGSRTNTLAVIAIWAAIFWVFWLGSVIAVLCGFLARKQIRENGNVERGDGLALAAIIIGGLELIPAVLFIFAAIAAVGGATAGAGI